MKSALRINFKEVIQTCDDLVREGRIDEVHRILRGIPRQNLAREFRLPLARLARRLGANNLGLKFLTPVISPAKKKIEATAKELAEYAVLLSRVGSVRESIAILSELNHDISVPLYLGFCHVSNRDFIAAKACFELFLEKNSDPYLSLVAQVNFAASLVATNDLKLAEVQIQKILVAAEHAGAQRLLGNALEIEAQLCIKQNQYDNCRRALDKASSLLSQKNRFDEFFLNKWRAVLAAKETNSIAPIIEFEKMARRAGQWEVLRELDRTKLEIKYEQKLFDHLYYGTPYEAFRKNLAQEFQAAPSPHYFLGPAAENTLDLKDGRMYGSISSSKVPTIGQLKLLNTLCRDFYAPIVIGELFSALYPTEKFNIFSSPFRVRQSIYRLNLWFREENLPVHVEIKSNGYQIEVKNILNIKMSLEIPSDDADQVSIDQLRAQSGPFTWYAIQEICSMLNLGRSTGNRFVRRAVERGLLRQVGSGRATRYMIVSSRPAPVAA